MERYGDALEADFHREYHLSLGQLIRSGLYRKVLNLIGHLPQASFFHQLAMNDEEFVTAVLRDSEGRPTRDWAPSMAEYDLHADLLTRLNDAVQTLTVVTLKLNGNNGAKVKPMPRPETVIEEIRERKRAESHRKIVDIMLRDQKDHSPPVE